MQRKIKLKNLSVADTTSLPVNLRCPECHHLSTLDKFHNVGDKSVATNDGESAVLGYRICPNSSCRLLFNITCKSRREGNYFVADVVNSIPQERLDFDATDIPASVVNPLEEAITCHANNCYIAGAIMVRKTLEELCKDKGATGKRLVDQIKDLLNHVIVPHGLLKGLDNLRLLGNDAAHIELKHFDTIGQEEVKVGILFTKELLKAVYQSSQIADMLEALKKPSP